MSDTNGFQLIAKNGDKSTYQKWDPVMLKRVTVTFEGRGEKKLMHVKIDQPDWVGKIILENNVELQNNFQGYGKGDGFYHATCMPMPIWNQVMQKCGFEKGHGYDEKKFKQIVNDRDNYKLKVVPGRI